MYPKILNYFLIDFFLNKKKSMSEEENIENKNSINFQESITDSFPKTSSFFYQKDIDHKQEDIEITSACKNDLKVSHFEF